METDANMQPATYNHRRKATLLALAGILLIIIPTFSAVMTQTFDRGFFGWVGFALMAFTYSRYVSTLESSEPGWRFFSFGPYATPAPYWFAATILAIASIGSFVQAFLQSQNPTEGLPWLNLLLGVVTGFMAIVSTRKWFAEAKERYDAEHNPLLRYQQDFEGTDR